MIGLVVTMYLLTKEGDELAIIYSPEEKLRIGDSILIDDIVSQVIDVQFADLPGVLEHILRKSLISKTDVEEHIQPEVRSIIDSLTDQKLAVAKIRGRIVKSNDGKNVFKTGIKEFNLSRSKAKIEVLDQNKLFDSLELSFVGNVDLSKTLSSEPKDFDIMIDRLGINLITGMKGSGKSYFAKRLLLKLIDKGVLTIVFDLNGEYLNIWKKDQKTVNQYAQVVRILTPKARQAQMNEIPMNIPLNEISYDDFAHFFGIPEGTPTYQALVQFWRSRGNSQFDLNDLETFSTAVTNDAVRAALLGRVSTAKALQLFGPSNLNELILNLQTSGGAIIFNLSRITQWERNIIVEFVLRRLADLGRANGIKGLSLFLEEAQLYVTRENMVNILTRMRHFKIFPTFITNDPRTLPDEVFSLLDNMVAFMFRNEDELKQLAKSGLIDSRSISALRNLERQQCMAIGNITSLYPMFLEIVPQQNVMMGGETPRLGH